MFDNGVDITIEAKSKQQAFYLAKKKIIKECKNKDQELLDSMANQYFSKTRIEKVE